MNDQSAVAGAFRRETEHVQLVIAYTCGRLSASVKGTFTRLSLKE